MSHVFISYVRENKVLVDKLANTLKAHGVEVWLDRDRIKPGEWWQDAIREAISDGAFFIACFSKEYQARFKTFMNEELTLAIGELRQRLNQIWFIPVVLDVQGKIPKIDIGRGKTLHSINWVELYNNWDEGVQRILSVINPIQNIHGWSAQQVQALQQQTAQAWGLSVEFRDRLQDGGQGPLMVVIPGGRFLIGSPQNEQRRSSDERQHEVEVKPFAMGKYEVTFEEYERFTEATRHGKPDDHGWGRGRRPVINVCWFDAVTYTEWLSQQTGQLYRLPTEAEWEYACRAGTTTAYHFGAYATINPNLANYETGTTMEVGQYPANAWGLHDMHGNVCEWTCSVYDESYNGSEQRCAEPNTGFRRVLRGGAFVNSQEYTRCAARPQEPPHFRAYAIGFRVVVSPSFPDR